MLVSCQMNRAEIRKEVLCALCTELNKICKCGIPICLGPATMVQLWTSLLPVQ